MVVLVPLCKLDAFTVADRFLAEVIGCDRLQAVIDNNKDPTF